MQFAKRAGYCLKSLGAKALRKFSEIHRLGLDEVAIPDLHP